MTPEFTSGETYEATVTSVDDGDTLNVTFDDGSTDELRVIGVDTPETAANQQFERIQEWEGITDLDYLAEWGAQASAFAKEELVEKEVDVSFDPNEPIRGDFDRLLTYVAYERGTENDGSGEDSSSTDGGNGAKATTLYNRVLVEEGYARVYDSGFERHDELWRAEQEARAAGRGVWAESDVTAVSEVRDRPIEKMYFPQAASVESSTEPIGDERVPVVAESSATRATSDESAGDDDESSGETDTEGDDSEIPLAGIDTSSNVVLVGGLLIDETYELAEGFAVDTSEFGNFPFLTNCISLLTERSGSVLVDGGHGQFNAEYALSAEDAAYYKRYLEGQDIGFEQNNELSTEFLDRGRALLITIPATAFTTEEIALVSRFAESGGAVVLLGSDAPADAREHLNALSKGLDSDLRLGTGVRDEERNLDDDPRVPVTSAFDESFPLFGAYTPDDPKEPPAKDGLVIVEIRADAPGAERENLATETVTFENRGRESLSLAGWTVEDEADHIYEFPDGTELPVGVQVTVHTGMGTDSATDLYWGSGNPVWNNTGDTVTVRDADGRIRARESY